MLPDIVSAEITQVEVNNDDAGYDKYQSKYKTKQGSGSVYPGKET